MKKSLSHLPVQKQKDLRLITQYVLEALPPEQCEMIILYGSYARGDYVDYDQRVEFGVNTCFMSDFDLLVLTSDNGKYHYAIERSLEKVTEQYERYKGREIHKFTTQLHFAHESIAYFNKAITKGRYFYTDIKKEGILLYDAGKTKLARRRKLNFSEIQELAQEYFDAKFEYGCDFLRSTYHDINDKKFKMASFHLHQACENLYHGIILTYTLYTYKEHNLELLIRKAKSSTFEIMKVFPCNTKEEKRLFTLLQKAYVEARYNRHFVVTEEDIKALLPQVELLRDICREVCEQQIKEYSARIRKVNHV